MARQLRLMDLPEEMHVEVVARVPFESTNWLNLQLVNHHFDRIMRTRHVKVWVSGFQVPSKNETPAGRVVDLGIMFFRMFRAYNIHPTRSGNIVDDERPGGFHTWQQIQTELLYLRLLRLLPVEINPLLRYSALRLYEHHHTEALFVTARPQDIDNDPGTLADVEIFLGFEKWLHERPEALCGAFRPDSHEIYRAQRGPELMLSKQSVPVEPTVLVARTGRYLPSTTTIYVAAAYLEYTPFALPTTDTRFGFEYSHPLTWYGDNEMLEINYQMEAMQKLCKQIDAEDGEYASHILRSMSPEVIRPIMTRQAETILQMSIRELWKSISEEVEFLAAETREAKV